MASAQAGTCVLASILTLVAVSAVGSAQVTPPEGDDAGASDRADAGATTEPDAGDAAPAANVPERAPETTSSANTLLLGVHVSMVVPFGGALTSASSPRSYPVKMSEVADDGIGFGVQVGLRHKRFVPSLVYERAELLKAAHSNLVGLRLGLASSPSNGPYFALGIGARWMQTHAPYDSGDPEGAALFGPDVSFHAGWLFRTRWAVVIPTMSVATGLFTDASCLRCAAAAQAFGFFNFGVSVLYGIDSGPSWPR